MRPLKLRMKGFAAFREDTEVDFTDVEVAALVGPTGSGKSTIIDGITFALFGRVARLAGEREQVKPVIHQLATEARVSLDFELDGKAYTAVRVVRRTPAGATTKEARLECGENILAGRASEMAPAVESLLGLDFDRFTKTVVLPQGRFAQFLHDKASDRQELLRHLLDLGIYSRMGEEARRRASTAAAQITALEPELERGAPTAGQVTALAATAEAVQAARIALGTFMGDLASAVEEARTVRSEMQRLLPLRERAAKAAEVPDAVVLLAKDLQSAREACESAEAASREAREAATEARRRADEGPNAEICRRLVGDYGRLAELEQDLIDRESDVADAELAVAQSSGAAEEARGWLREARGRVEAAREAAEAARSAASDGPDRGEIARVRAQCDELEELAEQLVAMVSEREQAVSAEHAPRAEHADAMRRRGAAFEDLDRARAVKQAEGLVAQLVEGEPCPVCRQTVVELPAHDLDAELAELQAHHSRAEAAVDDAASALGEAARVSAEASAEARTVSSRRQDLKVQVERSPSREELSGLEAEADELAAVVQWAVAEVQAAERAESDLVQAEETKRALAAEGEAQEALIRATADRDNRRQQRDDLASSLAGEPDMATLRTDVERAEELAATRVEAEAAEQLAASSAHEARTTLEGLEGAESLARGQYGTVRDELVALSPPKPGASLLDDWEALAAWAKETMADLARQAEAAEERGRAARSRQSDLVQTAGSLCAPYFEPGDDPDQFVVEMAEAAASAAFTHQQADGERKARVELEERIERLRSDETVAAQVGWLLRSDGFERWLMEEAIGDLVERANERLLELSSQQYSFVADGTSFDIRDHHNADEVRGAKTLSGGETFLASLALALALSDGQAEMSPEGSPRLDSLFLDEGFGTLDPDALDGVAASIQELGATGRMVSIVTHIRELAEQMPVRFEVSKGPATSSVERVEV